MDWYISFRTRRTDKLEDDAHRVWTWMQALAPLTPALSLWRPTSDSRKKAYASPPITEAELTQRILDAETRTELPIFTCSPTFVGTIDGQGSKTLISFNLPEPGDMGVSLEGGVQLSAAIDASEDLADAIMRTSITVLAPTIGTMNLLRKSAYMYGGGPAPFTYSPGWKMFFSTTSPHHAHALQLATRTEPTTHGTLCTFGTPDTYPDILDQW
ncbi:MULTISPECIES: hypothetical protein [Actinomyces]|uniref:Uncharacterized protein n=1 Tax=Actinomyces respiraculi TaxID=2744574 RepID=A0A7T0PXH7_9ACTO|nr:MULTISPECIES: hypothetical protein [Actinomyces]QPL05635.1 hypothetical protein ID810_01160 [Actinomyces respiraculi]